MNKDGEMPDLEFPGDWPEGCPPEDALSANADVYRVVRCDPPAAEDFLSFLELGKADPKRLCACAGLSVFADPADALHYAEKYPYLGELIAEGALQPPHGKLKPTSRVVGRSRNSHTTWWPCKDTVRHSLFVSWSP